MVDGKPFSDPGDKISGIDMDATITAAWLYYHHNLTQAEIATQLRVSRPTVANLLSRARARGIVAISMRPDLLSRLSLAEELRSRFHLQNAYIVPTPEGATISDVRQALGKAGALYLESTLRPGEVIAHGLGCDGAGSRSRPDRQEVREYRSGAGDRLSEQRRVDQSH
jgi:DNA-binding transcriptional regulator LsrR (DeoR family)